MSRRAGMLGMSLLMLALGAPTAQAALDLSTDARALFFGRVQLGEEKELAGSGTYHNEIACVSTNQKPWDVYIELLQPFTSNQATIPLDAFEWQAVRVSGTGTLATHRSTAFQTTPALVYQSGPNETSGQTVTLQFKYLLRVPEHQPSGSYYTTVRFTLMERL